jgi:hypothetical protein
VSEAFELNCQDWYRVRRGEDELAWGLSHDPAGVPKLRLSRRARAELGWLEGGEQAEVVAALRRIAEKLEGRPVAAGGGRLVSLVGRFRIVFRLEAGRALVSTIRGGKVYDPENVGPAPTDPLP